ncbi:MAG: hypothetical protein ACK4MQ_06395 [Hyphomonas sp.]
MQTIRRIAGLLLAGLSTFLLWQGLEAVIFLLSRGSPLAQAVDAIGAWRIIAAAVGLIGGLMAAAAIRFGAVVALVGTLLFAALGAAFILFGADSSIWMDEVVGAAGMAVLTGILLFVKRG